MALRACAIAMLMVVAPAAGLTGAGRVEAQSACAYSPPGPPVDALSPLTSTPSGSGRVDTFRWAGDVVQVTSVPTSLDARTVRASFGTFTDWPKGVAARNLCSNIDLGTLFAAGRTFPGATMTVTQSTGPPGLGAETLVFRKPGFLGIWIDSAHFTPSSFWTAYGGRTISIAWIST